MSKHKRTLLLAIAFLLLLTAGIAYAQTAGNYDLHWWTLDGGGGRVTAGSYVVEGTAGQPDASNPVRAGSYQLTGGYWSGSPTSGFDLYLPLQTR